MKLYMIQTPLKNFLYSGEEYSLVPTVLFDTEDKMWTYLKNKFENSKSMFQTFEKIYSLTKFHYIDLLEKSIIDHDQFMFCQVFFLITDVKFSISETVI